MGAMRRAKIVCTLGPATSGLQQLEELVRAGIDVARLNLSHGSYADHEAVYHNVRAASNDLGRAVGILVDLQGPKIRTTRFSGGPVELSVDQFARVAGGGFILSERAPRTPPQTLGFILSE